MTPARREETLARQAATACTGFSLRRAARSVARLYDAALAPSGLTGTQFTILNALRLRGATPVTSLAELLLTERTTLTRNLALLVREGLVEVRPGNDRRVREASLTATGRQTHLKALPLWKEAQSATERALGKRRLAEIRSLLSELEGVHPDS